MYFTRHLATMRNIPKKVLTKVMENTPLYILILYKNVGTFSYTNKSFYN